ncbi:hypothetical protein D7Y13_30205 [Corallococcus praedator]|uniref:CMP/dCMP-type deaminase domain-containing protein n=1 Tax=Corallococcus praedator TaxID=2316724 RepID=A0ABX9QAQ0_9BACT|nr:MULTISPECIES: nucleic acid/nucleotide deaminase domain-containing protein [Corallococcus]RKH34985.1 hypothetical protein D7X75_06085 [Corallococcus sp. CA031C]RKH97250.1 hypothetical protein D7Y13_30205 [Corallococcus praedator]
MKCQKCSNPKKEAISAEIKLCVTHYVDEYVKPRQQGLPANQHFSRLGDKQYEAGQLLAQKLQGTAAPLQANVQQNADLFWWGPGFDKVAQANEFGTCVAFCAWGNQLIIATNDDSTFDPTMRMEKLTRIAGAVSASQDLVTSPTSFIFLNQVAVVEYQWGPGGTLQVVVGGGPAFACDHRNTVHAEMRILEYLHQANAGNARADVYIAISKPCCVKCEAVMAAYNAWNVGVVTAARQGNLTGIFGQWKIPAALKPLTQTIPYWRALKNANM